ncbi:uncharacterized protein LOC135500608 [Lineus longissimus]|uniref:uncharacterized protein LOC135500608 n=1 Tax=Lineus longissimus TaxID=88925 RepID=UPI00315DC59D
MASNTQRTRQSKRRRQADEEDTPLVPVPAPEGAAQNPTGPKRQKKKVTKRRNDQTNSGPSGTDVSAMFTEMRTFMSTMMDMMARTNNVTTSNASLGATGLPLNSTQPQLQYGPSSGAVSATTQGVMQNSQLQSNQGPSSAAGSAAQLELSNQRQTSSANTNGEGDIGEPSFTGRDINGSLLSVARPLYYGVSDRIREKVWAGKYVDFHKFLKTYKDKPKPTVISTDEDGVPISLSFGKVTKDKPLSLIQWLSCFDVFASVYGMKFPNDVYKLVRYSALVKEIAHEGGDWCYYDENFRKWRQEEPLDWLEVVHTLYMKAHTRGSSDLSASDKTISGGKNQPFRANKASNGLPKGTCFVYQNTGKCNRGAKCKFQHTCAKCKGKHPTSKCYTQKGSSKQGDTTTKEH